ncbi:MAG: hypothetical protein NTY35_17300 [Planctomycetota bacterium]|nr:hypothetical protein [Planctomycetota bacterium]
MNFTPNEGSGAGALLAIVTTIAAIVTTVFWMIVGWRAMRAHERIADTLNEKLK